MDSFCQPCRSPIVIRRAARIASTIVGAATPAAGFGSLATCPQRLGEVSDEIPGVLDAD
jgi:hypothetical protein